MRSRMKWIAWLCAAALILSLLAACGKQEEADGQTQTPAPETRAEPEGPAQTADVGEGDALYARYADAAKKTASLKSEKLVSDITLSITSTFGENTARTTARQQSTQVFSDQGGPSIDFYSETTLTQSAEGAGQSVSTMTVWVKDGVACIERPSGRKTTDDLASLGLDTLREDIHKDFLYRLGQEDLTNAVSAEENGAVRISFTLTGDAAHDNAFELLQSVHAFEQAFGGAIQDALTAQLKDALEVSQLSVDIVIGANGYFAETHVTLNCYIPLSEELQRAVFDTVIDPTAQLAFDVDKDERFVEPGTEFSVELPLDGEVSPEASTETGAASLEELLLILGDHFLFTERAVDCMGQEFLMACLDTCDHENAVSLFEERDSAAIAALLNERFFQAAEIKPIKYEAKTQMELALTEESRAATQAFFQQNHDQVVALYGETFFRRVSEENLGREQIIFLQYTTLDEDGNSVSGPADMTSGLMIMVVNGRYYWNDFSLFQAIAS